MNELQEKKKREYLIGIISAYLDTSYNLLAYYKAVADTRKAKLTCTKSMKRVEEAKTHLRQIKHIEVLDYLYATFIGNNVIAYSISGSMVLSPKLAYFDTDNGIDELRKEMEEQRNKQIEQDKKRKETLDAVNKAKAEGKKVEMVWDKDTKTVKPMIIKEKPNA